MDVCLLDLIYSNDDPQSFARQLYEKIAEACVIDLANPDEESQTIPNNQRSWAYMLHIVQTALDHTASYTAVVAIQYALNREESLKESVLQQLSERRHFFAKLWLPFLERNTLEFTNRFRGTNATEVMQDYANIMMDAWWNQRIRERPATPPPPPEDNMDID